MIQFVFGWPGILIFIACASAAAWLPSTRLMWLALVLSLPSAGYVLGGNGWIQLVALYIPASLIISALLLQRNSTLLPKVLLLPIYGFYVYLASAV